MIIEPDDYRFTFAEMTGENGALTTNVRNWMARGVVKIGEKHKLGRWLFSASDRIRIRFIDHITRLTGMSPADAHALSEYVIKRFCYLAEKDLAGEYPITTELFRQSAIGRQRLYLLAGWAAPMAIVAGVTELGLVTVDSDDDRNPVSWYNEQLEAIDCKSHVMVPIDEIIGLEYMKCMMNCYLEDGEEWPILNLGNPKKDEDPYQAHFDAQVGLDGMIGWFNHFASGAGNE